MSKPRSSARAARPAPAALGPGLHPGRIEAALASAGTRSYRVALADGRSLRAALGPGVVPALADECLRDGRTVVLMDTPAGAVIAGALQVAPSIAPDAKGTLALDAKHLRLRAGETLTLEVPGASVRLEPGGAARIEGDRLVIDMAAVVRIFSARVDIP